MSKEESTSTVFKEEFGFINAFFETDNDRCKLLLKKEQ